MVRITQKREVFCRSAFSTFKVAYNLAKKLRGEEIILLEGELGVGKTLFVKGLAKGLGIKEEIISPTFIIMRCYKGRLILYHIDLYRIGEAELQDLLDSIFEYPYGKGVVAVEWGDKLKHILHTELPLLEVKLNFDAKYKTRRQVTLSSENISITDYFP